MPYFSHPDICPVCEKGKTFWFARDYAHHEGKWSLYGCSQCATQFWVPFKNPGNKWYEDQGGYVVQKIEQPKLERGSQEFFLKWLKTSNLSPGTLLDLGCSTGGFINEAQKLGWKVWGNDFDREAIKVAKKAFGLENVYSLNFEEFFNIPQLPKFDVVTFFEVLEHVDDPREFIGNVKKLVKDDGLVVLSTPSRERMLPEHLKSDFPPHHLTRWNEAAAQNLFLPFGFAMTDTRYVDQFKFLRDCLADSFRFGLVQKTFKSKAATNERGPEEKVFEPSRATNLVHFFAHVKDYIIFSIPALVLFILGKITNRKNGDMVLFFKKTISQ